MNEIIMYTDGSCLKNPDGPGGCAVILLYDKNGKPYEKRKSIPNESTTNNKMEIMACLLYTSPSPRDLSTSRMPSSA